MSHAIPIALVGDFDAAVTAHRAIPEALQLSARWLGLRVAPEWVHTEAIGPTAKEVSGHAGIWCVPASPYANMAGALAAIRRAREWLRPFLGTCGGFQHAVLEYARNVLGYPQADHAETAPDSAMPLIGRLSCSLRRKKRPGLLSRRLPAPRLLPSDAGRGAIPLQLRAEPRLLRPVRRLRRPAGRRDRRRGARCGQSSWWATRSSWRLCSNRRGRDCGAPSTR